MKPVYKALLAVALATAAAGCNSALDINQNPNSATSVNADAELASALAITAYNYSAGAQSGTSYNTYAAFAVGHWSKSGVVSGFAEERQYSYSTTYYQGLFNNTYDNLNDYNLIQKQSATYPNHAAIARIMKVYNYLLLVDEYGDIPYSQALQGTANVNPAYDKAADIYKDFIVQLKGAISDINAATNATNKVGAEDIVFGGNMTKWKQFANSLRLRILLRESSTSDAALNSYVASEMSLLQNAPDGFITADVTVQPGYAANNNQQNPFYNRYGYSAGSTKTTSEYSYVMPTNFIIRVDTLTRDPRAAQQYAKGKAPGYSATNTYVGSTLGAASYPLFTGTTVGSRFLLGGTFLRSPSSPTVLMLLAEHLFSKAEAETRGLFTGGDAAAKTDYQAGIQASFAYTFGSTAAGAGPYGTYMTANATNGLVDWDANTTVLREGTDPSYLASTLATPRTVSKTDKILFQKWLAENTVASTEAWDDYRRTAQPKFAPSLQSASPRADKLPTRLFYPQTELSTNAANVPAGVNQYTKIFWDVID